MIYSLKKSGENIVLSVHFSSVDGMSTTLQNPQPKLNWKGLDLVGGELLLKDTPRI